MAGNQCQQSVRDRNRVYSYFTESSGERKNRMKKILVVEDAHSLRKDILEMLGFEGFHAIGAENGLVGVQRAREHLPDLDHLRHHDARIWTAMGFWKNCGKTPATATIPFIFLTARTERMDMRQGMELGADDFLTKPFHAAELLATVSTRLRKHEIIQADAHEQMRQTARKYHDGAAARTADAAECDPRLFRSADDRLST